MSFDLFGKTQKRDIRVGYISTDRGYVRGITILEANKYAFKNPGTVFILQTRDSTRYLNINEVNNLTPEDVLPSNTSGEGTCNGIVGLSPRIIDPPGGTNNPRGGGPLVDGTNVPPGGVSNNGDPRSFLPRGPVNPPTTPSGPGDGTPTSPNIGPQPSGIKNPEQQSVSDGSPIVVISGSGGVGAKAIPVIGNDGGVLDIKLIHGGFGYKTPPRVSVIDPNRRGSGVVASSEIGVSTSPTLLTYTEEDDFEIYNFDPANGNPDLSGYGERRGVNGESLGEWDPNLYASLAKDPIGIEIARYQAFLREFKNPWWSTRKEIPLSVAFGDKKDRVVHEVVHHEWDDDPRPQPTSPSVTPAGPSTGPNTKYEEVEFLVYTQGGNQVDRGMAFKFVSEDGSHKFQFKASNYKDNTKNKVTKRVKVNTKYKVTAVGSYKGGGVEQGLAAKFGRSPKEIKGNKKSGNTIFADFTKSANDNDDFQIRSTVGRFTATNETKFEGHSIQDLEYEYKVKKEPPPKPSKPEPVRVDKTIKESFMNSYAISPVPMSDVAGSDFAGRWCTFEWEEDFPYTGEYVFRGMADNIGRIYLDNDRIMETRFFRGDPLPSDIIKKTVTEGVHKIKVELFNVPIKEPPKPQKPQDLTITYHGLNQGITRTSGERKYPIKFEKLNPSNRRIEVSGNNSRHDNNTLKLRDGKGSDANVKFTILSSSPGVNAKFSDDGRELKVKGSGDVTIRLKYDDNPNYAGEAVRSITIAGTKWRKERKHKGEETKTIKVGASKEVVGKGGYIVSGDKKKVKMKDGHGDDINSTFSIESSTNNARFSNDGKRIESDGPGEVKLKLKWDDNPKKYGVAVDKITVGGVVLDQRGEKGSDTKTLVIKGALNSSTSSNQSQKTETIFTTTDYINKADRKLWRTNLYKSASFLNDYGVCPFNTIIKKNEDYDGTHIIRWEHVTFPADGNYQIEVEVDDRVKLFIGNRSGSGAMGIGNGLKNIEDGGDEVIIEKNGFVGDSNKGTGKSTYTRFFRKGQYRIRAELYQKPGGNFGFGGKRYGQSDGSDLSARFVRRGNDMFMVMDGNGSATVNLSLKMDDNPNIKGDSCRSVRIGDVELKRTIIGAGGRGNSRGKPKEKEVIRGSGTFVGGERYKVVIRGASAGSGTPRVSRDNIELLDAGGNDTNGTIRIGRIRDRQGAPVKGLNPMSLAVRIRTDVTETTRISPRTWNQNPMGAAFTIDAPLPPIPVSPKPISEGRCPDNPTWTTRFSGSSQRWWPVTHKNQDGSKTWSKFMNRFAISPLPPLSTESSDGGGGVVYATTWDITINHAGFYALKGTVDNGGRILVDDIEKMRGGYFQGERFTGGDGSVGKLAGFGAVSPPLHKFYLEEGPHTITVEVENQKTKKQKKVEKKIFSTKDFRQQIKEGPPTPAELTVEYRGLNQGITKTVSGKDKEYPIIYEDLNSSNLPNTGRGARGGIRVVNNGKKIELKDSRGSDANVEFEIRSTSPGVSAKFSDDGRQLKVKGRGDVTIRIKYDDYPGYAGEAVRSITIAGTKWRKKRTEYGEETHTINVGSKDTTKVVGKGGYIVNGKRDEVRMRDGHGNDINSTFKIETSTVDAKFSSDGKRIEYKGSGTITFKLFWNDDPKKYGVAVDSIAVGGKVWDQKGERGSKTQTINVTAESNIKGGVEKGTQIGGVTYDGPRLFVIESGSAVKVWSKFMQRNAVSPFIPPIDQDNPAIVGENAYVFKDVNFFESGRYKFLFQSDDGAILYINGNKIAESKSNFRGKPNPTYAELSAGKFDVKVVVNNINLNRNILARNNPTGFALKIMKDVVISEKSLSWQQNPVGISAMMIPPPCPKVVQGKGVVTDIIVRDPGNGMPPAPQQGVPTIVTVKDIEPTLPGINYSPDDPAIINGIPTTIQVDNFGRVTKIDVPPIIVTSTPVVEIPSLTGVGFRGTPIMQTTIVPEEVYDPEDLIQVTDLVGLKQTGYVNGKPYYGSVFSKDGVLFAGVYETTGDLIPVYATLQESIDGRVTTRPSAILRQGTDVNSNNPRLNIPGTPENLI